MNNSTENYEVNPQQTEFVKELKALMKKHEAYLEYDDEHKKIYVIEPYEFDNETGESAYISTRLGRIFSPDSHIGKDDVFQYDNIS